MDVAEISSIHAEAWRIFAARGEAQIRIEMITVDLPHSLADEVRRSVESGRLSSESLAVRVASQEWQANHLLEN